MSLQNHDLAQIPQVTSDFLNNQRANSRKQTGPDLIESCAWLLGSWVAHLLGFAMVSGLLAYVYYSVEQESSLLMFYDFLDTQTFTLVAGEQYFFVLMVMLVAWLRLRPDLSEKIGCHRIELEHLVFVCLLTIPLAILCGQIHVLGMSVWNQWITMNPWMNSLNPMQSMDVLNELSEQTTAGALILVMALAPAISEELMFRGVIGRGLISRYGIITGVMVTSFLFAIAHVHPVHALAVFPLGVVLHFVYLVTRSFWAPVLLHLGNNSLAVISVQQSAATNLNTAELLPWSVLITALFSVIVLMTFLWHGRWKIDHHSVSDEQWNLQVGMPLAASEGLMRGKLPWRLSLAGMIPLIGFMITLNRDLPHQ